MLLNMQYNIIQCNAKFKLKHATNYVKYATNGVKHATNEINMQQN